MFPSKDRQLLRDLAARTAEIANLDIQQERRERWMRHNSLNGGQPMLLVFPEGAWVELIPPSTLQCSHATARLFELMLRQRIYHHEHFPDDTVMEREWVVNKAIRSSGWGLQPKQHHSDMERGAWGFNPVILDPADLDGLKVPTITHDELRTQQRLDIATELFGDFLEIKLRGVAYISYHLMQQYTALRGLEQTMVDMIENPGMLHDAIEFITAAHQQILEQYIQQNLLSLNNNSTYHSSGGNGYSLELPPADCDPARVRPEDMWASAEVQEMAGVSPEMHVEFAMNYEKRLLAPFGLTGYGCCEDLSGKLADVLTIPQIRRISISPFADVDRSAEQLGNKVIFSWKPKPAHLVGKFNEVAIREYIRHTLQVAQANGCTLEIILKDTHTCEHHPERFDRWLRIANEEIEAISS